MKERYYIGAYWGARGESPAGCAERLARLMAELATCHELVATWNRKASTFADALKRTIVPTVASLKRLFRPYDRKEPEVLGYRFSCWNGRRLTAERMNLSISCGGVPDFSGLSNCVVLHLPDVSPTVASFYEPDVLLRILRATVNVWEPDWGVLMSHSYSAQYIYRDGHEPPPGKPDVGWMTYLRARRLGGLAGTPPCEVVDMPDRGAIFVVTREHRFSVEKPDDVARAQRLTEYLEACGALVPIPTNEPF